VMMSADAVLSRMADARWLASSASPSARGILLGAHDPQARPVAFPNLGGIGAEERRRGSHE
jgi:hypothetical protein